MIEVTYLNNSKQEAKLIYENFEEFERAQFSCSPQLEDYYKVIRVTYNDHILDYNDNFGNLFFYLSKLDRSLYEK